MTEPLRRTFTYNQVEIIKASLYFDVFNYPLTRQELFENSAITISHAEFSAELDLLLNQNILKQTGDFIQSINGSEGDISKRAMGNAGAAEVMPLAYKYSKRIASFPFVDAVMLSGALSKNYYDENGDIDFFIITRPGRLWICRSLLILRFKFLSRRKQKYWCTNYFISSDSLSIPDTNVFTGTELAYLIPTINYPLYQKLLESNSWYKERFPNKAEYTNENVIEKQDSFLKWCLELLFGGKPGAWLDHFLLYLTLKRWQKKYPELSKDDFDLQYRSRKNVCKRHTRGFQNKVLVMWEAKQKEFEMVFNTQLR